MNLSREYRYTIFLKAQPVSKDTGGLVIFGDKRIVVMPRCELTLESGFVSLDTVVGIGRKSELKNLLKIPLTEIDAIHDASNKQFWPSSD